MIEHKCSYNSSSKKQMRRLCRKITNVVQFNDQLKNEQHQNQLTIVGSNVSSSETGRVVVEGDVPLPSFSPAVVHHDVVLGPADEEARRVGLRAGVVVAALEAAAERQRALL